MIPPQLVKDVAAVIAEPLTSIFNYSIENCYPANWKMGTVTPLFKKDDELCKVNYRPVTVLPALNNIFERLLARQTYELHLEILSDFISAYRKLHSCETSLLRLAEDWRMMRDRWELVAVVSMDHLFKAFDVIQYPLLLSKLKAYGMDNKRCALLRHYLSGRSQRVKIGDTFPVGKVLKEGFHKKVFWGQCFLIYSSTTCFTRLRKANSMHMRTIISYTLLMLTQ